MDELYEHLDNLDPEWKKTKEYKKFLEMDKTTKETKEAAMKLKREVIARIAQSHIEELANENFRKENIKELVADFHPQMKAILADIYMESRKILDEKGILKNKDRMNKFTYLIVNFVDSLDKLTENGKRRKDRIIKEFPEFTGTSFDRKIEQIALSMDEFARLIKERDRLKKESAEWDEINKRLDKIFGNLKNNK